MKLLSIYPILFIAMLLGLGCGGDAPTASTSPSTETQQEGHKTNTTAPERPAQSATADKHNCQPEGSILDNNQHWIRPAQTLVTISADSTTKDIDFGESHRIFTAINTTDCSTVFRETLPVNHSPDFPWYLSPNTYEATNQVLCMQGMEFVFCYDLPGRKMLKRLSPKYLNKRMTQDAQSGAPAGLTTWNQYLIGYALDLGAWVFDLSDKDNVRPIMPQAEYFSNDDETYHSLFLLPDDKGNIQAFLPSLNQDQTGMTTNPLFEEAKPLNTSINARVRNNRYIVLNTKEGSEKTAIDMEKMQAVGIPEDVAKKNVNAILEWLKK